MTDASDTLSQAVAASPKDAGYFHFVATAFRQTFRLLARRRRTIIALLLAFLPVLLPVFMATLSGDSSLPRGQEVFIALVEKLYLRAVTPLLALFFACMLVGEDIESHTIHYVLVRPVPRSAWVVGKFLAYCAFVWTVLLPAVALVFAACTNLGSFGFTASNVELLLHYCGVLAVSAMVYGAFGMFLGALTKRPVVYAILYLFLWQRAAVLVPGVVDFLTLEKYLGALLPPLAIQRDNPAVRAGLIEFQRAEFAVGAWKSLIVLAAVTVVFVALTTLVVRLREFTAARAAGT